MNVLEMPSVDPSFDNVPTQELPFREAAARWFMIQKRYVAPRTCEARADSIRRLTAFFAEKPLRQITRYDVLAYQDRRKEQCRSTPSCDANFPGHRTVNKEVEVLRAILNDADPDLWGKLRRLCRPLPTDPLGPGQALSHQELRRLIEIARGDPRWFVALCCVILSANTTAAPGEIRNLRLKDTDLEGRKIVVRKGIKNVFRARALPLNDEAFAAAQGLVQRAREKGASLPDHYLLPGRPRRSPTKGRHGCWDPTRPIGSWKKAWHSIVRAFAKEFPQRAKLRLYDLRHTAITHLLSNPLIPPQVVVELAGHANQVLIKRYSHQSEAAKRAAVNRLTSTAVSSTATAPTKIGPASTSTMVFFRQLKSR